ncbi:glycosyltransferase family 2 protein [Luteolibacter sp. AS25]|uniref:glycosyltransferase family 2 protein n=1 Tax=Luteolibacter sp. AS25 TaxID=3135776 RepID=UPI00398B5652
MFGSFVWDMWFVAMILLACVPLAAKVWALGGGMLEASILPEGGPMVGVPFFSVHVAIHDEPPGLVIETLEALMRSDYPAERFEVIVIDNNTFNPAVWMPVAKWCEGKGDGVRFFHRDHVRGAKAGALNIALEETAAEADHVVVVDADYQVFPGFLRRAASLMSGERFSHVQFPQAYRGAEGSPLVAEYDQYFRAYGRLAGRSSSMLLTGTMSVIRKEALQEVGGWPLETITEDAHLGARLLANGGRGIFADEIQGTGLLPNSIPCLSRQRVRWAMGNACVLRKLLGVSGDLDGRFPLVAGQLCAWLQGLYLLVPLVFLAELGAGLEGWRYPVIFVALLLVAGEFALVAATVRGDARLKLEASLVRLALSEEGARGLLGLLPFHRPVFIRTPKDGSPEELCKLCGVVRATVWVMLSVLLIFQGFPVFATLALFLCLRSLSRLRLARILKRGAARMEDAAVCPANSDYSPT